MITVGRSAPADYICDGVADQTEIQSAITAALAAGSTTVHIKEGTYNCTAGLDFNGAINGFVFEGEGQGVTKLIFSQTGDDPGLAFGRGNSTGSDLVLASNAVKGDRTIALVNASTLAVGDWILLKSLAVADTESAGKCIGEMLQITAKATNTITVHDVVKDDYLTADTAAVVEVTMLSNITLRDMSLSLPLDRVAGSSALSTGFVDFRFVSNLTVERVEIGPAYHSCIQLRSCVNVVISDSYFHDMQEPLSANLRYGIWVANASQDVTIHGCKFRGVRHSVTTGTNSGTNGNGIQRGITVSACVSEQSDTAHYDCHQPCDGVLFVGCVAIGGMVYGAVSGQAVVGYQSRGRNVSFVDCLAQNIPGRGFMIQGAESDNTRIIGCTISHITQKLGGGEGVGIYVDTGGSWRHLIANNMVIDTASAGLQFGGGTGAHDCVVTGNVFDGCSSGVSGAAVRVVNAQRGVFSSNRVLNNIGGAPLSLSGTATGWTVRDNDFVNNSTNAPTFVGVNVVENNMGYNPASMLAKGNVTGATTINLYDGAVQTMTLTGNVTFTLPSGALPAGLRLRLIIKQDATGGRTTAFPGTTVLSGHAFVPSSAANSTSVLDLFWDGSFWIETSRMTNGS